MQDAQGAPQEAPRSTLTEQEIQGFQELKALLNSGNLYSVLSIEIGADDEEVKQAYYTLSRRFHPDRFYRRELGEHTEMVEQVFAGINHAYNTLKDPDLRRRHEKELRLQSRRSSRRRRPSSRRGSAGRTSSGRASSGRTSSGRASSGRASSDRASSDRDRAGAEPPRSSAEAPSVDSSNEVRFSVNRARAAKPPPSAPTPSVESTTRRRSGPRVPPAIEQFKRQIAQRLAKGRRNYKTALEDMENEAWIKAASGLYLAMQYDPNNAEYKRLYNEVRPKAAQARADQFIAIAENAEGYRNIREAIANYESAVECNPPTGLAFFRLGQLLQVYESDSRSALQRYRQATEKEPSNTRYRMALADLYLELDMRRNAHREYQIILQQEPRNSDAKSGLKKSR